MKEKLWVLEQRLGASFSNKELLMRALTHKSAHRLNNERLEFLGDALLSTIIADLVFKYFKEAPEGELTRARAFLVKKDTLSLVAQEMGLGDFLYLGIGEKRSGGFSRDSILSDALEALIGALYLDQGFKACFECVERLFQSRIENLDVTRTKDPKTQLQELLQSQKKPLPRYEVLSVIGEPHAHFFTVVCHVEAYAYSVEGQGRTRRFAEQIAAQKALEKWYESSY